MRLPISQREARQLRKRVAHLESVIARQRSMWSQEYVGGVQIASDTWDTTAKIPAIVRTARKLGHAVVVVGDESHTLRFIALPHADMEAK